MLDYTYDVLVSLPQLVWIMYNICNFWGSNFDHNNNKKRLHVWFFMLDIFLKLF